MSDPDVHRRDLGSSILGASLTVANCSVFGDVWGTDERPGSFELVNVTVEPDAWIEKYMSEDSRINSSALLEEMGFQWDGRRGDWLKPLRRVDGSISHALWHETRFAKDGARGGIPGCRQDYPMFDPDTGRRILLNETLSHGDWEWHVYPGLDGYCERVAAPHARQQQLRLAQVRCLLAALPSPVCSHPRALCCASHGPITGSPALVREFLLLSPSSATICHFPF